MDARDFKKLLIDLELSMAEISRQVGISHTAVRKYLGGRLRDPSRRKQIRTILTRRAREKKVRLPAIWPDGKNE